MQLKKCAGVVAAVAVNGVSAFGGAKKNPQTIAELENGVYTRLGAFVPTGFDWSAHPMGVNLELPESGGTAFKHFNIALQPGGHPSGAWLNPHFDLHFFTKSVAEVGAIAAVAPGDDCKDGKNSKAQKFEWPFPWGACFCPFGNDMVPQPVTCAVVASALKTPRAGALPSGFGLLEPLVIPGMGAHYADQSLVPTLKENDWISDVWGFWEGESLFYEPMFTVNKLQEEKCYPVAQGKFANGKNFPTKFCFGQVEGGVEMWLADFRRENF